MEALGDRLAAAAQGHGSLVFLAGEARAGKTSVIDEFCAMSTPSMRHVGSIARGSRRKGPPVSVRTDHLLCLDRSFCR